MYGNFSDKEIEEKIRNNLIAAIKQSGLKQTVIAKKACISNASLSDYIHKNKLPSLCTFVRICKAIDVPSEEILDI